MTIFTSSKYYSKFYLTDFPGGGGIPAASYLLLYSLKEKYLESGHIYIYSKYYTGVSPTDFPGGGGSLRLRICSCIPWIHNTRLEYIKNNT